MSPIQNFAFEGKLVRVIARDGEPWFVAMDVCAQLEIKNVSMAIEKLDNDERDAVSLTDSIGRSQMTSILSESGVFALVLRSKLAMTPGTVQHRFRKWVTGEVLPQIRRTGRYERMDMASGQQLPSPEDREVRALRMVTEARLIYGKAAAARLWAELGLPAVPAALPDTEPEQCLARLLDWQAEGGEPIGNLLRAGLAGDDAAAAALLDCGLRIGDGCFTVANAHPVILRCYRGTRWRQPYRFLRHMEGAIEAKVMRYGRNVVSRGVELPAFYADDETLH